MQITEEQIAQLGQLTKIKMEKMFLDKKQTPKLLIPKTLPSFVKGPLYSKFLQATFRYCFTFNRVMKDCTDLRTKLGLETNHPTDPYQQKSQKQQDILNKRKFTENNQRGVQVTLLQSQREVLGKLERQISYCYAEIILSFNFECIKQDGKRSNFKDQVFFEALIYLVERVIKEMFTREEFIMIQQQINRLFRTNRYNLIRKRHENDHVLQKYPALKQQKQKHKNNLAAILSRAPQRIAAFKKYEKEKRSPNKHSSSISYDYTQTLGIPRQLTNPDMEQRSPLLCTWLPSRKTMVEDFSHYNAQQNYLQAINMNAKGRTETVNSYQNIQQQPYIGKRSRMASMGHYSINNGLSNSDYRKN